jgi:hypothetical protein
MITQGGIFRRFEIMRSVPGQAWEEARDFQMGKEKQGFNTGCCVLLAGTL